MSNKIAKLSAHFWSMSLQRIFITRNFICRYFLGHNFITFCSNVVNAAVVIVACLLVHKPATFWCLVDQKKSNYWEFTGMLLLLLFVLVWHATTIINIEIKQRLCNGSHYFAKLLRLTITNNSNCRLQQHCRAKCNKPVSNFNTGC